MQHLSTAFLIYALVIVVNQVSATAHFYTYEEKTDQLATEAKNRAVTIIDGPKYVGPASTPTPPPATPTNQTQPETRPPSKPPINPPINPTPDKHKPPINLSTPDKHGKPKYIDLPRVYVTPTQLQNLRSQGYTKVKVLPPNSVYKYQKVISVPPNRPQHHPNSHQPHKQQLVFAASTNKPFVASKSPKFSLPIETINGIRADFVRPPHFVNTTTTTTTTTTEPTTTTRYLRTKRIWPKHILEKQKASNSTGNSSDTNWSSNKTNSDNDLSSAASYQKIRVVLSDNVNDGSPSSSTTRAPYRRVTRAPSKKKLSTAAPGNFSAFEHNDWVPIVPSHYPVKNVRKQQTHIRNRRSDRSEVYVKPNEPKSTETPAQSKSTMYFESFGLLPVASSASPTAAATAARKRFVYGGKNKQLKPHVYSGYRGKPVVHTAQYNGDYQTDESDPMRIITRIKHHHHHHHHRYVKTVEKPVRVEVPKPVPVPVPMPVPVKVEKKVPYPVHVKVPHPFPVKVVEKEYVPKPYPVMQQVPVEVIKTVEVKVPHPVPQYIEKRVPYPVQVQVPVPKPYPVPVEVEKKVPYPVPVRILVPQPYPVETKVPVPVKEQVEVIKHVPVRVPVPQPYPVKVPQPVPVPYEKKVPYPVEVEKKVPVPYKVPVPTKVEVEKKVPVFVPRPFPVEKKVPYPVKVPYAVRIPIRVPVGVPILVHPSPGSDEHVVSSGVTVNTNGNNNNNNGNNNNNFNGNNNNNFNGNNNNNYNGNNNNNYNGNNNYNQQQHSHYAYAIMGNQVSSTPQNTVPVFGNQGTGQALPHNLNNINSIINTITDNPHQIVTVHGQNAISYQQQPGFQSRSDNDSPYDFEETTTPYSSSSSQESSSSTSIESTSSTESTLPAFSSETEVTTVISTTR